MAQARPSLASPAQLLAMLSKGNSDGGEPPLEELLSSVQRQAGAAPPLSADQLEVFPEPGFLIKTANEQGQKVFINVCGSGKVPLPGGWKHGQVPAEVKQYLEGQQGGDAPPVMRFPLSMGPPRLDQDHKGEACLVLDCILNSDVLTQCAEYRPLKLFVIQLAIGTAEQKNVLQLDPKYKLPKMRYKGGDVPLPQLIRMEGSGGGGGSAGSSSGKQQQRRQPLVAEVVPEEAEKPAFALLASNRQQKQQPAADQRRPAAAKAQQAVKASGPEQSAEPVQPAGAQQDQQAPQQLHPRIEYIGKPASAVCITVPLPAAAAAAVQQDPGSACASVCAEAVRVQVPGCQPLEVQLPLAVTAAGGTAELAAVAAGGGSGDDAKSGGSSLVLTLPYHPFSSILGERQAAVAADGNGGGGSETCDLTELD